MRSFCPIVVSAVSKREGWCLFKFPLYQQLKRFQNALRIETLGGEKFFFILHCQYLIFIFPNRWSLLWFHFSSVLVVILIFIYYFQVLHEQVNFCLMWWERKTAVNTSINACSAVYCCPIIGWWNPFIFNYFFYYLIVNFVAEFSHLLETEIRILQYLMK